jgi:hypothetical protein
MKANDGKKLRHIWGPATWVAGTHFKEAVCAYCGVLKRTGFTETSRTGWTSLYINSAGRILRRNERHCDGENKTVADATPAEQTKQS